MSLRYIPLRAKYRAPADMLTVSLLWKYSPERVSENFVFDTEPSFTTSRTIIGVPCGDVSGLYTGTMMLP